MNNFQRQSILDSQPIHLRQLIVNYLCYPKKLDMSKYDLKAPGEGRLNLCRTGPKYDTLSGYRIEMLNDDKYKSMSIEDIIKLKISVTASMVMNSYRMMQCRGVSVLDFKPVRINNS